jgi:hypothetical protein
VILKSANLGRVDPPGAPVPPDSHKILYGLIPNQISHLYRAGDIDDILNAGRAKGPGKIPPVVTAAFDTSAQELHLNLGKRPTDGTSRLGKAY